MQDRVERGEPLESFSRLRNRLDANISQQLGNGGNLPERLLAALLERRRAGGQLLRRLQQPVARRQLLHFRATPAQPLRRLFQR